ncbi:unnamed protein product [Mytilus coruscus]|uniref:NTR domain-containing protein n=1 Tax=Mytilus coruscus TaxID=42192 RepID=A0A6J8CZA5_MYTCO|nr:unnamed protein product [Mytilus coruscus]
MTLKFIVTFQQGNNLPQLSKDHNIFRTNRQLTTVICRITMKTTIVTLFCLMLINFNSEVYGCKCDPSHKNAFCRADFVSRGIVQRKRTFASGAIEYEVDVKDNFKIKVKNVMKLRSNTNSCGVSLLTGSEYLISGEERSSPFLTFYKTNACFWIQNWKDIAMTTQIALSTRKFANC